MSVLRLLDPQLEHAETCSTAEATRGHYACVHAVVCGMNLRTRALLRNPEDSPLRNPGRLIFLPPLLSQDAVRPWTCAWPSPLQRQLAEMLHRRLLIVSWRTTELKSENLHNSTFTAARKCGPRTGVLQSQRATSVGEVPSSQLEARNPNRSFAEEVSHGSRSSPKPLCEGGVALRRHN